MMDVSNPRTSACNISLFMGSSDSDDDFQKSELDPGQSRRVYLFTYSKANVEKLPSRQSFSSAVTTAFGETGAEVNHWACCQGYHKNKDSHYHMTVNMTKLRHWKSVKEQLKSKHNIYVPFYDKSLGYVAAYSYICKCDKEVLHSENLTLEILAPPEPKPV